MTGRGLICISLSRTTRSVMPSRLRGRFLSRRLQRHRLAAEFGFRGRTECCIRLSRMAPADKPAWRILVVDDEPLVCDSITRMLAGDEQTVVTATSAEAALAALQHARFDLIIVDYQLPGMKGDELAVAVKSRYPHLALVMITAYPETLASSHKELAGVDLVISKPLDLQELRRAVAKFLTKS